MKVTTYWDAVQPVVLTLPLWKQQSSIRIEDWEKKVGVGLISRFPQLSFIDIEYKNDRLQITVDINETYINHQCCQLQEACLYYGCIQARKNKLNWCNAHSVVLSDPSACQIARTLLVKQLAKSLTVKAKIELTTFLQSSVINLVNIELHQIVPHFKYEIGPIDKLSRRALDTLTFVIGQSQILLGYNYAVYGDETSVYLEFDSHDPCPKQFEYKLEWYGDDESDTKTKHSVLLSFGQVVV